MNDLLTVDVRLLVLRYGRAKVLQVLARLGDQTLEDLERQLNGIAQRIKPKRDPVSVMDLVAVQAQAHPDIAEHIRTLAIAFENRTFLPQLRDVQRFLDRIGATHGRLKSRAAAAPAVIRALAKLSPTDLAVLVADKPSGDSDFSLLARAIMGTPARKKRDPTETD
jgi:hypothetical protein